MVLLVFSLLILCAGASSMDPPYTHPGMYQPQQLWSPDPYRTLAPNYYSYPRATHGTGVEVAQAVRGCNRQIDQSDNEGGESEVS